MVRIFEVDKSTEVYNLDDQLNCINITNIRVS